MIDDDTCRNSTGIRQTPVKANVKQRRLTCRSFPLKTKRNVFSSSITFPYTSLSVPSTNGNRKRDRGRESEECDVWSNDVPVRTWFTLGKQPKKKQPLVRDLDFVTEPCLVSSFISVTRKTDQRLLEIRRRVHKLFISSPFRAWWPTIR